MPWLGSLDSVKYLMKLPKVGKPKKSQLSAPTENYRSENAICWNKYSCVDHYYTYLQINKKVQIYMLEACHEIAQVGF